MQIGRHPGRATGEVQWGESSTGNAQVAVCCVVESGPCSGEALWWVGSLASPQAAEITIEALRALGARLGNGDITDLEGLGSRTVTINAKPEVYDGKERWRYSISSGFGFKKPLGAGDLEALRQRMRGQLLHGASKAAAPAQANASRRPAQAEDDIPF